ncbi:hypothetical protein BR93DRAFT_979943 [Coniochaeta sp. PMI_546]|nr:hypothetical protein BR93DRAFT_979943 [Coniochaeta sp. PMI_546]
MGYHSKANTTSPRQFCLAHCYSLALLPTVTAVGGAFDVLRKASATQNTNSSF